MDIPTLDIEDNLDIVPMDISPNLDLESVTIPSINDSLLVLFPPIGDATFQFYKFYQINKNQVLTTQTNMPISIIDTLGFGILQQASGFDIRVFDSAGVPIPYDTEFVNPITGNIIVWINMANVNDLEFIQLTFGKPSATDGQTPNAVYDINYQGVYHLDETTFGVGDIIDSTGNGNDGDGRSFGQPLLSAVGQIGDGISIRNRNAVEFDDIMVPMNAVGTVSIWASIDDLVTGSALPTYFSMRGTSNSWEAFYDLNLDELRLRYGDPGEELVVSNVTSIISSGVFHYYTFIWDQPNGTVKIYIDGNLEASKTVTPWTLGAADNGTTLGNIETLPAGTSFFGVIDEAKFSDIERSADWIKTEFNNQSNNDSFWHKTPLLENGVDNFLVDEQERRIVATGQ